jgi:hypothetical protein
MADVNTVRRIVKLNGGRLTGKTRLQKSAYFLESYDVGFGLEFEYHHYGPYSEELASLAEDARDLQLMKFNGIPLLMVPNTPFSLTLRGSFPMTPRIDAVRIYLVFCEIILLQSLS